MITIIIYDSISFIKLPMNDSKEITLFVDNYNSNHSDAVLLVANYLSKNHNLSAEIIISENKQLAFVCWNMTYKFRGKNYLINGVSKLDFDDSGKIIKHEDYWDASFPLYGAFPLLGLLMKGIKRFVSVKPPK